MLGRLASSGKAFSLSVPFLLRIGPTFHKTFVQITEFDWLLGNLNGLFSKKSASQKP